MERGILQGSARPDQRGPEFHAPRCSFTLAVSAYGAYWLAQGGYWEMLLGAVITQIASILDGNDGELARLKIQTNEIEKQFAERTGDTIQRRMNLKNHRFLVQVSPYRIPDDPKSGLVPRVFTGQLDPDGSGDRDAG